MNSNQGITEKARHLEAEIKRIASKYEKKDLSATERNDAMTEIKRFNEQVEGFSLQLGNLQGKPKRLALAVINSLKKIGAGFEKNINDTIPGSEFI